MDSMNIPTDAALPNVQTPPPVIPPATVDAVQVAAAPDVTAPEGTIVTPSATMADRLAQLEAELSATKRIAELEAELRNVQAARAEAAVIDPVAQEDIEPFGSVDHKGNWRPG